jgi:type II secretory pathway component PulM
LTVANSLNLRPSERRLLVIVGLILFVVVNIWFIWPHFGDLGEAKFQRSKALDKLAVYNEEIGKQTERQAEVERLSSATAGVPGQDQEIQLLRSVQQTARANGVSITGSSRQTTQTNNVFFSEQSQNITALSGEEELLAFLYELGSGNSTIRVREITVRPDPQRYQLSSNIKLVSSHRLEQPARPKQGAGSSVTAKN